MKVVSASLPKTSGRPPPTTLKILEKVKQIKICCMGDRFFGWSCPSLTGCRPEKIIVNFQLWGHFCFGVQVPTGPTTVLVVTLNWESSLMGREPKVHDKLGRKRTNSRMPFSKTRSPPPQTVTEAEIVSFILNHRWQCLKGTDICQEETLSCAAGAWLGEEGTQSLSGPKSEASQVPGGKQFCEFTESHRGMETG